MSSLKECPFCNSSVSMQTHVENQSADNFINRSINIARIRYEIRCKDCDLEMYKYSQFGPLDDIKYLQDRWNNRVPQDE